MIDRARIARLDVSVVSTQRGSVWSVRNGQWWIPEPTIPSQCRVGNFFRNFDPSGRFSGIFLDFFQIFFGGRRHVPSVSRATHRADAIRDQPLAEMRCSCGSRPFVANGNAAPPQTSENPIPVTVCGFSTAAPEASLRGRFLTVLSRYLRALRIVDVRRRRRRLRWSSDIVERRRRRLDRAPKRGNACICRSDLFRWLTTELRFRESKVKK